MNTILIITTVIINVVIQQHLIGKENASMAVCGLWGELHLLTVKKAKETWCLKMIQNRLKSDQARVILLWLKGRCVNYAVSNASLFSVTIIRCAENARGENLEQKGECEGVRAASINITSDPLVKSQFWPNQPFKIMAAYIRICRSVKQLSRRAIENKLPIFSFWKLCSSPQPSTSYCNYFPLCREPTIQVVLFLAGPQFFFSHFWSWWELNFC